jgi:hypothetical protein
MSVVVDFAEMLRALLEDKINECGSDIHESNIRAETDKIMVKIQALEWVQGRIQDIIINNVTKDWPAYNK